MEYMTGKDGRFSKKHNRTLFYKGCSDFSGVETVTGMG
jgi:hypothetical protein